MDAAMQEEGLASAGPYAPLAQSLGPNPSDVIDQLVSVTGSRTELLMQGVVKAAPNRMWDPATSRYHWTSLQSSASLLISG